MGCPEDYVAVPMLVLAGLAIGATRRVALKAGWAESACLYAAVVGSPGTTKSPVLKAVVAPVEARQRRLEAEYDEAMEEYSSSQ
jgi:hypothetical protein